MAIRSRDLSRPSMSSTSKIPGLTLRPVNATRSGWKIFQPLRVALTGLSVSPGIFDVLLTLGRERSLARIAAGARAARVR